MNTQFNFNKGFTIIELLVVIIVLGILVAIVARNYTVARDDAWDTSVKGSLQQIGATLETYYSTNARYPAGSTELSAPELRLAIDAAGFKTNNLENNLLYCRRASSNPTGTPANDERPDDFAIVAVSKTNNVFTYTARDGAVLQSESITIADGVTSASICQQLGIDQVNSSDADWFYSSNAWQSYVKL